MPRGLVHVRVMTPRDTTGYRVAVDRASRSCETVAAGQKKTNAIRVHEIFADAINYPRPVASATGERSEGGGGRGSERAMGTPRWPRRKGIHPQKGSGALEMKGRMDVPRQVQETRKGIHLIQGSLKFLIR